MDKDFLVETYTNALEDSQLNVAYDDDTGEEDEMLATIVAAIIYA